jgi:DNA-binding transcriptional LysR family regulator
VLVAGRGYLSAHGTPQTPADLTGHATIVSFSRGGLLEWRFRDGPRDRVVRLTPRLLVNDIEAMLLAARANHGIARALSYQVVEECRAGILIRLLPDFEPPPEPVHLLFSGGAMTRPSVKAFVDFAADSLRRLDVVRAAPASTGPAGGTQPAAEHETARSSGNPSRPPLPPPDNPTDRSAS